MKRILLMLTLLFHISFAQSIETLIQNAYKQNFALKSMGKEVEINEQSTEIADNWDNPILSAGLTDIQLDDISSRTLEPMQTQFIALSQKIPLRNKNSILKEISNQTTRVTKLSIEDQKAKIASNITILAYKSMILDRYLELTQKKALNLKKMKNLTLAYQKDADHSLDIDLQLLKLENRVESLQYKKEEIIQKIQKLTVIPVRQIDADLTQRKLPKIDLNTHPKLDLLKQQLKIANTKVKLMNAKKTPDLRVSGGYFQREHRDDYINLSFAIPLPITKREEVEVTKSKLEVVKIEQKLLDLKNSFENEVALLQKKALKSKKIHTRYIQNLLPKQEKITALMQTKNRLGKATLTQVISSLNASLDIEVLAFEALEAYFEAYGKLRYYQ